MLTYKTISRSLIAAGLVSSLLATASAEALTYKVSAAERDRTASRSDGGHAFWMPDSRYGSHIPNGRSSDFLFMNDSGRLHVSDDMTSARMTGTIQSVGDASSIWEVDINFILGMNYDTYKDDHVDPNGDTHDGRAKKELRSSQYVSNGGTVDTSAWKYFYMDEDNATLTGADGSSYDDVVLDMYQRPNGRDYGKYVFQLGEGANGKNLNMGMSGWLGYNGYQELDRKSYYSRCVKKRRFCGYGDINVDLEPVPEPISAGLATMGLGALVLRTRRRRA